MLEAGQPDYNAKDDKGNKMGRLQAEHMAKHRVRCGGCQTIFCSGCQSEPYHAGKTCEEAMHMKEARKCRFCAEEIHGPSSSMKQAFRDVCRKAECVALMSTSCDKMHPCNHPCKGFAGEKECMPCLNEECIQKFNMCHPQKAMLEDINEDAYCTICYTAGLGEMPCVQLTCKHVFHV